MAYCKDTPVTLKHSASLVARNLAVLRGSEGGDVTYGVIHKNYAAIRHHAPGADKNKYVSFSDSDKEGPLKHLTQIRWCRLKSSRVVLVVTSYVGFKITNWDGSEMLYQNQFETRKGSYSQRFARGATSVDNVVCVGTSEGDILVYSIPPTGSDVVFSRQLQGHSAAITDLCRCSGYQVASSDENGMIIVWANPVLSAESSLVINEPGGVPCLCLCYWDSLIAAGFSNGLIRLYNVRTGQKTVEIAAHARCINGLDVASDSGLLLSVSEDCTASVWRLPTYSNPKVDQVFCAHIPDSLLCGGKFCDSLGARFAITAFEATNVMVFKKTS